MADLAQKIITYMIGTRQEIIDHGVEGLHWTSGKYVEFIVGVGLIAKGTDEIPIILGVYLVANTVVRYSNMFYNLYIRRGNLEHLLAAYPGIIGTIRERTK